MMNLKDAALEVWNRLGSRRERPDGRGDGAEHDLVIEASEESFPASDPPAYTGLARIGMPARKR